MMFTLMEMNELALILGALLEVVDNVDDREHHGFLETLLEAHPLLGVGVLIEEVIKVLCTQQ